MLNTKSAIRKEIRQSTKFIRDKLKSIEKNMMNKFPDPGYAAEKMDKVADETKYIKKMFVRLSLDEESLKKLGS